MNCIVRLVHYVFIISSFGTTILKAQSYNKENNVGFRINHYDDRESSQNPESKFPRKKWITQLFYEARMEFQMDSNVNTECKKDFDLFNLHLQNQSLWAIKMMESSEWPLGDIFSGAVDYLGNYDECLTISSYGIKGQYCLPEVRYDYPPTVMKNKIETTPDETLSVWEALNMYEKNPIRMNRKNLRFAMCIPSACKPVDLKISLISTLNPVFKTHGIDISVDVNPILCKTREELTYPLGYYIVGCSFIVFFLFVILCTLCDANAFNEVEMEMKGNPTNYSPDNVWKSFSIIRNFQKLFKWNPESRQAGLYFIKVCYTFAGIYAHRLYHVMAYPTSNAIVIENVYIETPVFYIIAALGVDIFFMISGFLKFRMELLPMSIAGKLFLFLSILLRWLRMVPVAGVVILFIVYVLPYIGEGPIWDHAISDEVNSCKQSWWTVLLAINNMVKTNELCLLSTWTIGVDIQLTIIGGILLYIYTKNKKIGAFAALLLFVVSTFISFIVCYVNEYDGVTRFLINTLKQGLRNDANLTTFYMTMYTRIGPYLIGFLSAWIVKILEDNNWKFIKMQTSLLFLISALVTGTTVIYGTRYYDMNAQIDKFENALYAAINHTSIVTAFAVNIILYFSKGHFRIFQTCFNAKIWIPLGRLAYIACLVNFPLQLYHVASQKKPIHLSNLMGLFWYMWADVLLCHIIALILHLFVEAPISNLSSLILRKFFNVTPNKTIEDDNSNDKETKTTNCKKIQ